jgi:hypothetical protein
LALLDKEAPERLLLGSMAILVVAGAVREVDKLRLRQMRVAQVGHLSVTPVFKVPILIYRLEEAEHRVVVLIMLGAAVFKMEWAEEEAVRLV